MLRKKGLAFRLGFSILSVGFVVMFAILYYNYVISRDLALQDAKNDAVKLTELTVARIENVLKTVENIPTNLVTVIENRDTFRFVGTRFVIEEVLRQNPLIYGASIAFAPRVDGRDTILFAPYLYNKDDSVMFKNLADDDYNYCDKEWFTKARDEGNGIWTEPYYDKGGGEALMATYAVPFYRNRGTGPVFAGVVTADLSLKGMQELIQAIRFFESGRGFLISSKGNIVTWPEVDSVKQKFVYNIFEEVESPGIESILNRMVEGESGLVSLRTVDAEFDHDRWISFSTVPSVEWALGIIFDEKELYEGIHILYMKLIAIGFAGFLILGFLIMYISRRFVKPIEKLAYATKKIGEGEFDVPIPSFRFDDEVSQLGQSFRNMQSQLRLYINNLKETTAQKERMESELEIASTIQQQMLPESSTDRVSDKIDYYGVLKPARQIGGDLYDIILYDSELYFAIGDVSGKGIPAALFMAKTLTLFRAKVSKGMAPEQIAWEINRDLDQQNLQSMFVTCFIGRINLGTGELNYCNAGHNHPFILRPEHAPELLPGTHGIPLGSLSGADYRSATFTLIPGDKIFLYTDGISEAENTSKQLYGEERLAKVLAACSEQSLIDISNTLLSDIEAFAAGAEQADDITMLAIEFS